MAGGTRKAVHVEEEAKMAPEKVKNASRERGKGVWNRQGQVTLRVANPVVVSTRNLDHEVQAEQTRARFTFL